jgi:hypothetical protein
MLRTVVLVLAAVALVLGILYLCGVRVHVG